MKWLGTVLVWSILASQVFAEDAPKQEAAGPQSDQLIALIARFEEAEHGNDKWLSMQKVYNLGTPEAFAYLCRFAEDPTQSVSNRLNAMLLLKPLATEEPGRIRSTFLRLLDDPQPRIVEETAAHLSGLATADAIEALQKHWPADRPPAWATMAGLRLIRQMDSPAVKKTFQQRIEAPGMSFTKHGVVDLSEWSKIPPEYRARLLGFIKSRPLDRRRLVCLAARSAANEGSIDGLDFLCDRLLVDGSLSSFDFGYVELQIMERMLGKHQALAPSDEEAARARKIAGDSPTCPVLKNQGRLFVLLDRGHPALDGYFRITVIDAKSHKAIKTVGYVPSPGIPVPLKRLDGPQQTTETTVPPQTVQAQPKKYQIFYGKETKNLKAKTPVLVLGTPSGSFGFSTLSMQIDLVLNMNKYPSWHARWTPEAEIWLKYRGEQLRVVDRLTVDDVQRDGTQIRVSCRRTISTDKERSDAPYLPVACVVLGKLPPGKYEVQWIVKTYRPGDEEHPNASAGATPASEKPETLQHSFTVEPAVEKTTAAGIQLDGICKAFPIGEHIPPDRFSAHPDLPALARIAETDIDSLLAEGFGKSMIVINPQRFEQFKKTTRMSLRLPQDGSKAKDVPTRADYEKYMASWREQEVRRGEVDRRREIIWMIVKKVASTRRQVLVDLLDHKDLSIRWSTTQFLLSSPSLKDDKVVAALQALARDKPPAGTNASEMSREYFRRHETAVLAALVLSNWQVKEDMNDTPDAAAVGGTPPAGQQPTISGLVDRRFASISRSIKADFDNAVSPNNTINTDKRSSGQVWAWGDLQTSKGPAAKGLIREIQDVVAVSAGAGTLYALTKSGDVWAWGQGPWRVGAGTEEDQPTPIRVKGLSEVTAISAGFGHCLAMKRDGTVWAWGHNEHGQLGDGSKENRNVPVQVKGLKDVMAVSAGKDHSCTLRSDGTIWVWGDNAFGQCGESTDVEHYLTPVQMAGLSDVVAVSNGYTHNLALRKDGTVWQWGVHARKPSRVPQLDRVKAIAAGAWFALALKEDGTLWAWGKFEQAWQNVDVASVVPSHRREKRGELSLPEIAQQHYVPHQVMDWHDVTLITAECRAVVARKDGSVWQWGRDCPLRRVGEIRSPLALSTGWNMSLALTRNAPPENPAHNESTSSKKDLLSALTPTDDSYFRIRKNFHRLKIGMTKPEVAQVIGYPRFNRDSDRWNCEFMDTGMADKETYVVEFKNGTVIKKYGIGKHYARPREWE